MPLKFEPNFVITLAIANALMRIEAVKQEIVHLPITLALLKSLRETARLQSTHYSTQIEGNRLTEEEVERVIHGERHIEGRERDEGEVRGYYAALSRVEQIAAASEPITEIILQTIHALVMGEGKTNVKPSPYREGQNVIRESGSGAIVYLPPEAKDVSALMSAMVEWLNARTDLPAPVLAGIAHYQFATIHPYYDGNGRTARLLTTLILHKRGYDLKGIYSLEEYYIENLASYYAALAIGPSHNYYEGRAEADITKWLEYFCKGMAVAFEKVRANAERLAPFHVVDQSAYLRELDPRQRKALELFQEQSIVTAKDIATHFGLQPRSARALCSKWIEAGFLVIADPSKKGRKYTLSPQYESLVSKRNEK